MFTYGWNKFIHLAYGFSWLYGLSGGETQLQEVINGLINTRMYNSSGVFIGLICIIVGNGNISSIPTIDRYISPK